MKMYSDLHQGLGPLFVDSLFNRPMVELNLDVTMAENNGTKLTELNYVIDVLTSL